MDPVSETLKLLQVGKDKVVFNEEVVLVIGNSGSGKSTFVQYIACDNSKLIAKSDNDQIIIDGEGIGSSQTRSFTTFPDLYSYKNLNFYDCPGFKDTRDTAHDICATFFIKRVLDEAKRVKLVLVNNYSLIMGADRTNFVELLRHTSSLVKDCSKFSGSTFLVATRVNAMVRDPKTKISDPKPVESVIESISGNLMKIRGELADNFRDFNSDGRARTNALNLLDSLLLRDNNNRCNRLLVFRTPLDEGPLDKNELMASERKAITKLIIEAPYVEISPSDFGYYLSNDTQNDISKIAKKINMNISVTMNEIAKIINLRLSSRMSERFVSVIDTSALLEEEQAILKNLVEGLINMNKMNGFIESVTDAMTRLGMKNSLEQVSQMEDQVSHLKFFQDFTSEQLVIQQSDWIKQFSDCLANYHASQVWLLFLINLYRELSSYQVQINRKKYNVADINDWGEGGTSGIHITSANVALFIKKLKETLLVNHELPDPTSIDWKRLVELNELLQLTLKQDVILDPKDKTLFKNNIIRLEEIKQLVVKEDYSGVNLKIFATDIIYVDCSLARPKLDVSLIAPNIIMIGEQKISLNPTVMKKDAFSPSKSDPLHDGEKGEDGESGGNFLCLTNGSLGSMIVDTRGANGQDAQNGADGFNGADGKDGPYSEKIMLRSDSTHSVVQVGGLYSRGWNIVMYAVDGIAGNPGQSGGKGGDGGSSGAVFSSGKSLTKVMDLSKGGRCGLGGEGGKGGKHGRNRNVHVTQGGGQYPIFSWSDKGLVDRNPDHASSGAKGKDGSNGKDGWLKNNDIEFVKDISTYKVYALENQDSIFLSNTLKQFKSTVLDSSEVDNLSTPEIFYQELMVLEMAYFRLKGNKKLVLLYRDLLYKVRKYLSEHSEALKLDESDAKRSLQILYTTVLSKVCSFESGSQNRLIIDIRAHLKTSKDEVDKYKEKVFNVIVKNQKKRFGDQIRAKIEQARTLINTQMTVSIENLIDQTQVEITKLIGEVNALEKKYEEQKKALEKLKGQAKFAMILGIFKNLSNFLDIAGPYGAAANAALQLGSGVAEAFNKMEDKPLEVKELADGVEALNNYEKSIKESTKSKAKSLKKLIEGMLKEIDQVLPPSEEFLVSLRTRGGKKGPRYLKEKFQELHNGIEMIIEEMEGDSENEDYHHIETRVNVIEDGVHRTIESLSNRGNQAHENASNVPHNSGSNQSNTHNSAPHNDDEIEELDSSHHSDEEDEHNPPVDKKPSDDGKKKEEEKEKEKELEKKLKNMSTGFKALQGTVKDLMDGASKLEKVGDALNKVDTAIDELYSYKMNISKIIGPMLYNMGADLRKVEKRLSNKSQAVLDVAKWKVQSKLREIKLILEKSTTDFKAKEDFSALMVEFSEAMTTMIGLYDRIETYKNQAELADYIASLNDHNIGIERLDTKLGESVRDTRLFIQANIVIDRFNACVGAIKQWVFPFAASYLGDFELPEQLKDDPNMDTFMQDVRDRIEALKTRVEDYYSTVDTFQDKFVLYDEFDSKKCPSCPFYIWDTGKNREAIKKLLSGEEVRLLADPSKGPPLKAAIKFNKIWLNFKVDDKDDQENLNKQLKNFDLQLTHTGNFYYRYKNKIYLISGEEIPIIYDLSSDQKNGLNKIAFKLKEGDKVLSPFGLWRMQLIKKTGFPEADFEKLQIYSSGVQLELSGTAMYLDERFEDLNLQLDNFYLLDRILE